MPQRGIKTQEESGTLTPQTLEAGATDATPPVPEPTVTGDGLSLTDRPTGSFKHKDKYTARLTHLY